MQNWSCPGFYLVNVKNNPQGNKAAVTKQTMYVPITSFLIPIFLGLSISLLYNIRPLSQAHRSSLLPFEVMKLRYNFWKYEARNKLGTNLDTKGENSVKGSIFWTESENILQAVNRPFWITTSDGSSAFRKKCSML